MLLECLSNIRQRIDPGAVAGPSAQLKVKMCTERVAGISHISDNLPLVDPLPLTYCNRVTVCIAGICPGFRMINSDHIAVALHPGLGMSVPIPVSYTHLDVYKRQALCG